MSATSSLVLKARYLVAGAGREARRHSKFKVAFIAMFVVFLEAGLFSMFLAGFTFLGRIGPLIINSLFSLIFLGLGGMLAISSVLTSYAAIYRSDEIPFLITRPYTLSEVVIYKFFESCMYCSWAFFFIVVPFIAAYARYQHLSPLFALWTFMFSLPFVVFWAGIGTVITMILVRWTPRGGVFRYALIGCLAVVALYVWTTIHGARQSENPNAFMLTTRLIPGLHLAANPMLPNWWVAEGISSFGRGAWARGLLLFVFSTANALMITLVVELTGRLTFYNGWQRVLGATSRTIRHKPMLEWLNRLLFFLPHDVRAIILKDARTLFRDPMQWSQFLIFFGLLGLYFASLRSFKYDDMDVQWRSVIAFLNIFSVSTVLCSLASRFVYPQLSLEGQSFWILGLSPTSMGRILLTKFGVALVGMCTISISLMLLSTRMLRMTGEIQLIAVTVAGCMSLAVSGMSTGMGAIFLDLRERNPAAIVSGFGGTLNLVLSLGFMLTTLLPLAVLSHLHLLDRISGHFFRHGSILAMAWLFTATIAATVIPLWLGRKALVAREY